MCEKCQSDTYSETKGVIKTFQTKLVTLRPYEVGLEILSDTRTRFQTYPKYPNRNTNRSSKISERVLN